MQSRRQSLIEAWANTLSGFVISLLAGEIVFPAFGFQVSHRDNLAIVLIFTVISVVRSYVWRRIFNKVHSKCL